MFKWSAFPFIRLSIGLSLGIILSEWYASIWDYPFFLTCIAILVLAIVNIFFDKRPIIKGSLLLVFFVYLGGLLATLSKENNFSNHYSHFPHADGFVGTITSDHNERKDYNRYEMEVNTVQVDSIQHFACGKIYLYIDKSAPRLRYGDVLAVRKSYFEVSSPKNPEEFNYRKYLSRQNIYAHAFISAMDYEIIDYQPPHWLLKFALGIRVAAQEKIQDFLPQEREQAIVSALILGIKDHLDNEVKLAYASAGAMHVLAVSGLHVGILYLLLQLLFKPWKDKTYGRFLFMVTSIVIIWMYALITGFSPSVVRAATMFSVVIVSKSFKRRSNIYNALGIAAFLLIVTNPFVIYAVGFQLSFAAVLGIVIIHPLIYNKLSFYNQTVDYVWSITCVSIAAQIATFPLTLLYFNQFPTYFLVSNLIVIPAAFVMFFGGIFMLLAGGIWAMAGKVLGFILQMFVSLVNEAMIALQHLPHPLFDWLYFDQVDVILVYGIILLLILAVTKYNFQLLKLAAFCIMIFVSWSHVKAFWRMDQHKIVIYEIEGITAIDLIQGNQARLLVDNLPGAQEEVLKFQVNPYRLANGLDKVEETWETFEASDLVMSNVNFDLLSWAGCDILIPHDLENREISNTISADIVLIRDSKSIWKNLKAKRLLLGTGFKYYEEQKARAAMDTLEIPIHSLSVDGYWSLDLKPNKSTFSQLATLIH
ncbi:MAG: ComEC/Rec2 family competence protein [Marinoscillum sp.]